MQYRELFLTIFFMYFNINSMEPEKKEDILTLKQLTLNCISSNLNILHKQLKTLPDELITTLYKLNRSKAPPSVSTIKTKPPCMVTFFHRINYKTMHEHRGKTICICGGHTPCFKPSHLLVIAKKEPNKIAIEAKPGPCSNDAYSSYQLHDPKNNAYISALSIHPTKDELCIGTENGRVLIYNLEEYKQIQEHKIHNSSVTNIGYDENSRIISADMSNVCIWSLEDGFLVQINNPIIQIFPSDNIYKSVLLTYDQSLSSAINKQPSREVQLSFFENFVLAQKEKSTKNIQSLTKETTQSAIPTTSPNTLLFKIAKSRSKNYIGYIKEQLLHIFHRIIR